jgi:hypothetical protein
MLDRSREGLVPKPTVPEGATKAEVKVIMKKWLDDVDRAARIQMTKRAAAARAAEAQKTGLRSPPARRLKIEIMAR